MKFEIGERVVHLTHGVGTVVGIENRQFNPEGNFKDFYILEIKDNGLPKKVLVPLNNAEERLRKPVAGAEKQAIIAELNTPDTTAPIDHQTWNRRYREYMELVHTGHLLSIVQVLKSLRALREEKDLSFGERKLFDMCKQRIESELEIEL